jgi:hypothetical protein
MPGWPEGAHEETHNAEAAAKMELNTRPLRVRSADLKQMTAFMVREKQHLKTEVSN